MTNPIDISLSALNAARIKLKVIATNIANAQTPGYQRKDVEFETQKLEFDKLLREEISGVKPSKIFQKETEYILRYDPNNPLADENGYVKDTISDPIEDMASLIEVSRYYEANLNAVEAYRSMNQNALNIGR
mgnify:CR=1 FL=1